MYVETVWMDDTVSWCKNGLQELNSLARPRSQKMETHYKTSNGHQRALVPWFLKKKRPREMKECRRPMFQQQMRELSVSKYKRQVYVYHRSWWWVADSRPCQTLNDVLPCDRVTRTELPRSQWTCRDVAPGSVFVGCTPELLWCQRSCPATIHRQTIMTVR